MGKVPFRMIYSTILTYIDIQAYYDGILSLHKKKEILWLTFDAMVNKSERSGFTQVPVQCIMFSL